MGTMSESWNLLATVCRLDKQVMHQLPYFLIGHFVGALLVLIAYGFPLLCYIWPDSQEALVVFGMQTWAVAFVLVLHLAAMYAIQFDHAVGYGQRNIRYLLPALLTIALIIAVGLTAYRPIAAALTVVTVTVMAENNVKRGVFPRNGYRNGEWAVEAINGRMGTLRYAFLWSKSDEMVEDLEEFLGNLVPERDAALRAVGGE